MAHGWQGQGERRKTRIPFLARSASIALNFLTAFIKRLRQIWVHANRTCQDRYSTNQV
jgi:hypothetical protein